MNICNLLNVTAYNTTTIHTHDFTYGFFNDYSVTNSVSQLRIQDYAGVHDSNYSIALLATNNTNGSIKGNTYVNEVNVAIPSTVSFMHEGRIVRSVDATIADGFKLSYLDTTKKYDVIAKPVDGKYEGKVIYNVIPYNDLSSYKFTIFANYDKVVSKKYGFKVQVVDVQGTLTYVLDNAPANITIDNTGYVSVEYIPGVYEFTVNVSSDTLQLTKSLIVNISVT